MLFLVLLVGLTPAGAQAPVALDTFRVFLTDGRVLASHGEFVRVGDHLVFVVKLGGQGVPETMDVVTVPLSRVDMDQTTVYARALRSAQYGAARGEREYAVLIADVTRALADLEATPEAGRRLEIAQAARARLSGWSAEHFEYRAADLQQLASMFDEVISELRAAAGFSSFSLDFVARLAPPGPLLPALAPREAIEAALDAASATDVAAEKIALLRSADKVLAASDSSYALLRTEVSRALSAELAIEATYRQMFREAVAKAEVNVRKGNSVAQERLVREVVALDRKLGGKRPREMAEFLRRMQAEVELARQQEANIERWERVRDQLLAYELRLQPAFNAWVTYATTLSALRAGRGGSPGDLDAAVRRFSEIERALMLMKPPPELRHVHVMFRSAVLMARQACVMGQRLGVAHNAEIARNASAAVAGAHLLLDQGRRDMAVGLAPRRVR